MEHLETISEVFEALGGNAGVIAITGNKPTAVSNWKVVGRFPAKSYLVLQAALKAVGKTAPAALWGMETAKEGE